MYKEMHLNEKNEEHISEEGKKILKFVRSYSIMQKLSDEDDVSFQLVSHKYVDGVESVIGENYKFIIVEDVVEFIYKNKGNYSLIEEYTNKLKEMNIEYENRSSSCGSGNFNIKFVIKIEDLDKAMDILSIFHIF